MLTTILAVLAIVLVVIALVALLIVAAWKLYKKMGKPGWASLVPFYKTTVLLDVCGLPIWWILFLFIPILNIFIYVKLMRRLARVFGKGTGFTFGLVFLPFIFFPILAFGSATYTPPEVRPGPMTEATKWALIGLLACMLFEALWLSGFASPSHFGSKTPLRILESSTGYATDGTYVYYNDNLIPGADAETARVVGGYVVDDYHVYMDTQKVDGADPATFDTVDGSYVGRDKDHVFDGGYVVDGADPATYQSLGSGYAKDAHHVFYAEGGGSSTVEGADPQTFQVNYGGDDSYDGYDAHHKYSFGSVVK